MKKHILIILFISLGFASFAQHTFEMIYDAGAGHFAQRCSDGGYIIAGDNGSNGFLLKVNQLGDSVWVRGNYTITPNAIRQTIDGGFVFVGTYFDTTVVTKTDDLGNIQWATNIYDSSGQYSRQAINVFQLEDSSYAVGLQEPRFQQDIPYIISTLDKNGNWHGPDHEIPVINEVGPLSASLIQRTKEKGFVMTGSIVSIAWGVQHTRVGKIDSLWNNSWVKSYVDTSMNYNMSAAAVAQSAGGGYFVGGNSDYFTGSDALYVLRLNAAGDSLWSKTFGDGVFYDLAATSDSGLVMVVDSAGSGVIHLMKLNSAGNVSWERNFSGFGVADASHVYQDHDGGFIIIGQTAGNVYLIKTDEEGNILPPASISISGLTTICPDDSVVLSAAPGFDYLWNTLDTTQSISVNLAGDYFVTISDANGLQTNSDTVTINLFNVTTPSINQVPGDVLVSSPGLSYQWLDQNSQPIANADSIAYSPPAAGDYSVIVIDSNGCVAVSLPFNFIPVDIIQVEGINRPLIFNNLNGNLDVNINSSNINLRIYSIKGDVIRKLDVPNEKNSILRLDISSLAAGLYILEVNEDGKIKREKFVR